MSDSPLIKLDDLTKPATILVEKISEAVGGIFKPWQVVRVAKAEAEADQIRAESQIQISDIQRRAMHRFLVEEAKKQSNIEEITAKSLPLLEEESKPQDIEDDWITNFFDKSRIVSDLEMQQLWSKVLAGEANMPGFFSRQTVNLLSDLEKQDAELFGNLCSFGWTHEHTPRLFYPLVLDIRNKIYNKKNIYFSNLTQLEALGLIRFDNSRDIALTQLPKIVTFSYFGSTVRLTFPNDENNQLNLGKVILTRAGRELAQVCDPQPVEGFLEYVGNKWEGLKLMPEICKPEEMNSGD